MGPNLVVFDVDGTLTDTADVDSACFAEALAAEFDIDDVDSDWTSYSEFTDSMILREIFDERFGREPESEEISRLVDRFVAVLTHAHDECPDDFSEIPGAASLLSHLNAHPDWSVAVATGGWARSARLKLGYAGIELDGAPLAAADDSWLRSGIVGAAIERARERAGGPFRRIVLVGDTLWDVSTAAGLNRPFLGVGRAERAEALKAAGAGAVVAGFDDIESVVALLGSVGPPGEGE